MLLRADEIIMVWFLVLCRISSCMMLVPGMSSSRVPVRVRLFFALVISVVVTPLVDDGLTALKLSNAELVRMVMRETVTGSLIGLVSRLMIESLELGGVTISQYIGLSGMMSGGENNSVAPAVSTLVVSVAVLIMMLMEFPQYLVVSLVGSFERIPLGGLPGAGTMLEHFVETLTAGLFLALRVSAPFMMYGLIVNVSFAILGKFIPQVSTYFLSGPLVAPGGGLVLLYLVVSDVVGLVRSEFLLLGRPF